MNNTFDANLRRLEELTETVKRPDIPLEEALDGFEEGIRLAKKMEKELSAIEGRVQMLMNSPADDGEDESAPAKAKKAPKQKSDAPVLGLFDETTELIGTRNG